MTTSSSGGIRSATSVDEAGEMRQALGLADVLRCAAAMRDGRVVAHMTGRSTMRRHVGPKPLELHVTGMPTGDHGFARVDPDEGPVRCRSRGRGRWDRAGRSSSAPTPDGRASLAARSA